MTNKRQCGIPIGYYNLHLFLKRRQINPTKKLQIYEFNCKRGVIRGYKPIG